MGIGLAGDAVRQSRNAAGMRRRGPPRKTRHRKIEAAPEEMRWAGLAQKSGAEQFEQPVGLDQRTPEIPRLCWIIDAVHTVPVEGNGIRHLAGKAQNLDPN